MDAPIGSFLNLLLLILLYASKADFISDVNYFVADIIRLRE